MRPSRTQETLIDRPVWVFLLAFAFNLYIILGLQAVFQHEKHLEKNA